MSDKCDRNCNEFQYAECPGTEGPCIMQSGEQPDTRGLKPGWQELEAQAPKCCVDTKPGYGDEPTDARSPLEVLEEICQAPVELKRLRARVGELERLNTELLTETTPIALSFEASQSAAGLLLVVREQRITVLESDLALQRQANRVNHDEQKQEVEALKKRIAELEDNLVWHKRNIAESHALIDKIQKTVHEVFGPGERWSDWDVLDQGVALMQRRITELGTENHELKESIAVADSKVLDQPLTEHIAALEACIADQEAALKAANENSVRVIREKGELEAALKTERERIDWLNEQIVDVIYLDDGRLIDVKGNDVRPALDAARRPV